MCIINVYGLPICVWHKQGTAVIKVYKARNGIENNAKV